MMLNAFAEPVVSHNAAFQARLDDADPMVCPLDELQELLEDAPDLYSQGYLAGIMNLRQMMQLLQAVEPHPRSAALRSSSPVWTLTPARGMGPYYHHLHGLSRPVLLHTTKQEAQLIGAAPNLLRELQAAHQIIRHALAMMTTEQKAGWGHLNAAAGVDGEGITRANEREAVIAMAGGAR